MTLISANKINQTKYVHDLVAEHFLIKNSKCPFINHIDKNKTNNHYLNLEYIDSLDNKNNQSKQLFQYNLNYDFIRNWNSVNDILKVHKDYKQSAIRNNLCKISKSAYNFIWSYEENLQKSENKII